MPGPFAGEKRLTKTRMLLSKIWLFPVTVAILVPSTFVLTYVIAVWYEHAQPIFPYISDTGAYPPESCIFGQLLNIAALLVGVVMYLRHRQIAEFHRHARQSNRWFLVFSTIFLWVGYTSAFGLSMVANFQETNWLSAHIFGAVLAFAVGLLYCWAQTVFSYIMKPIMNGRWVAHVRLSLNLAATACFVLMFAFGFYPSGDVGDRHSNENETSLCKKGPVFIQSGEPGYESHLVTTSCEWLMTFAFIMYFMTYAIELRQAVLVPPKLLLTVDVSKLPKDLDYYCRSEIADYAPDIGASNMALPGELAEEAAVGKKFYSRTMLDSPSDLNEQVKLTKNVRKTSFVDKIFTATSKP